MWLYLTTLTIAVSGTVYCYREELNPLKLISTACKYTFEIGKIIHEHGLGICLKWSEQLINHLVSKRTIDLHHRYYIIDYPFGVQRYKIVVPRRRGPGKVSYVLDELGTDVTKVVTAFMGPCHNFHGLSVTPAMIGYQSLEFHCHGDVIKTFTKNETITI